MRHEHTTIVQQIQEVEELFKTQRDTEQHNTLAALLSLIQSHFRKEEDVLIPRLRQHLALEEFSVLIEEAHQIERTEKPSDIRRFMDADHRRVDRILEEFSLLKRRALQQMKAVFTRSKYGLSRHIAWEEELLFEILR